MVKWWDRFWGAVWMLGSILVAYLTGRWFAANAAPADLGGLRYGLIAFSALFGLLVGAFVLSAAVIGVTTGSEWLLARAGYQMRPPPPPTDAALETEEAPPADTDAPPAITAPAPPTESLAEAPRG